MTTPMYADASYDMSCLKYSFDPVQNEEIIILTIEESYVAGPMKFKIEGQALKLIKSFYKKQTIRIIADKLNKQEYLCCLMKLQIMSKKLRIEYDEKVVSIMAFRYVAVQQKQVIDLQYHEQSLIGCLQTIKAVSMFNQKQYYGSCLLSIRQHLLSQLNRMSDKLNKHALDTLKSFFQITTQQLNRRIFNKITPTTRILQGKTSNYYIFFPSFLTVNLLKQLLDFSMSGYNILITGRSGAGKSSSLLFCLGLTAFIQKLMLEGTFYGLVHKYMPQDFQWAIKIPKVVYISFRNQMFDYYEQIINQLPAYGRKQEKLNWTKSRTIFQEIKQFYKNININFRLVIDQVNIYTSFVRQEIQCKTLNKNFQQKPILDVLQDLIKGSKYLSVLYCSSLNIERNLFIKGSYFSQRATIQDKSDDIRIHEKQIKYESHKNTFPAFVEEVNMVLFQLQFRCEQTESIKEIQHFIRLQLSNINKQTYKAQQGSNSENILIFQAINNQFSKRPQEIFKFIAQNQEKQQFLQHLLNFLKRQSLRSEIQKYSIFLRKGSKSLKLRKMMIFEKLESKARQIVKKSQFIKNKDCFQLTLRQYNQTPISSEEINMENTRMQYYFGDYVTLKVFFSPQTFLFISQHCRKDEQAYTDLIRETLNAIGCLDEKFGQVIDSIFSKLISQKNSILSIDNQVLQITGEKLPFIHFSEKFLKNIAQKAKGKYDLLRHFQKIIKALEKSPKTNNQYYGAYPALMPLNDKGVWQDIQEDPYTKCSWCIDSLLANNCNEQGLLNLITFDFTAGSNITKTYDKYQKSALLFDILHNINPDQFAKMIINHKIIALPSQIDFLQKKMKSDKKCTYPGNCKIQFHSLSQFSFNFEMQQENVEHSIYKLIRQKLQKLMQADQGEKNKKIVEE